MPDPSILKDDQEAREVQNFIKSGQHHKLMRDLPQPITIPKFYQNRVRPSVKQLQVATDPEWLKNERQNYFAEQVEDAYYANRGKFSLQWLVQQHEEDLKFFMDTDFMQDIPETLRSQGAAIYYERQKQRALEQQAAGFFDAELDKARIVNGFFERGFMESKISDALFGATDDEKDAIRRQQVDQVLSQRVQGKQYRQIDIDRAMGKEPYDADKAFNEDLMDFMGTAFQGIGTAFTWAGRIASLATGPTAHNLNTIAHIMGPEFSSKYLNYDIPETVQIKEEKDDLSTMLSGDNQELKDLVRRNEIPELVWADLAETNPELQQDYIRMYGQEMAYMGFLMEFQDLQSDPEQGEQIAKMTDNMIEEGYIRPQQEYVDYLQEENFRNAEDMLEALAWWNEGVTGVAAGVTAFVAGPERETAGMADYFAAIGERVEKGDFTPAGVLGLDGTALGMGIDFFLPMMFDPTTYLFAPRGTFGANHITSSTAAEMAAKSPMTRAVSADTAAVLLANDRAAAGKAAALAPWEEVGLGGAMMEVTGYFEPTLPAHQWLNTKLGRAGHYAPLSLVESLLDEVQINTKRELPNKTIEPLARSIQKQGFLEPIVIGFDRASGRLFIEEGGGLKRLEAVRRLEGEQAWQRGEAHTSNYVAKQLAEDYGLDPSDVGVPGKVFEKVIDRVPVVIREVKPQVAPPIVKEIIDNPNDYVFHSTTVPNAQKATAEGFVEGGLTDQVRALGYGQANEAAGKGEQIILVFRKDQFPSNVQKAIEDSGNHLNNLGVDMTSIPKVRPIHQYPAAQGIDYVAPSAGPRGFTFAELGIKPPKTLKPVRNEAGTLYNPRSFFDDETLGNVVDRAKLDSMVEEGLKRGMDLGVVRQNSVAVALGKLFHDTLQKNGPMEPYLASSFNQTRIRMSGGMRGAIEAIQFLSSKHPEWANHWLSRLIENRRALNAAKTKASTTNAEIAVLRDLQRKVNDKAMGANGWQAAVDNGMTSEAFGDFSFKNLSDLNQTILNRIRYLQNEAKVAALEETGGSQWQSLFDEMMDDFKAQYIETNPQWADDLGPDGKLDWSKIHRGTNLNEEGFPVTPVNEVRQRNLRNSMSDTLEREVERAGFKDKYEPDSIIGATRAYSGNVDAVVLPASPVELLAATTRGGAKYTQWTQKTTFASMRAFVRKVDALWKANVLFSPRLIATLSVDELTSMAEAFGHEFVLRYIEAHGASIGARLQDLIHNRGLKMTRGSQYVSETTVNKLRTLDDIPTELRNYQNSIWEAQNGETIVLEGTDPGYRKAAETYVQRHLENPAWRAYLRGKEAFKEWVESPAGEQWVLNNKFDSNGSFRFAEGWEEAYQLIEVSWKVMEETARRAGADIPKFREAWEQAAAESGSLTGRSAPIAPHVYEYLGPIEGTRPIYPGTSVGWSFLSKAFERFADTPAVFRQSMIASMMRKAEVTRLKSLFESQGKRVMSDTEVLKHFENRGLPAAGFDPLHAEWLDLELMDQGFVTEAYISRLAENRARDWANNMTYSFEHGSRAGKIGANIGGFPFLRAWGDMWARWGRSIGAENILRPWAQAMPGGKRLQQMVSRMPFNARAMSRLSRLANTSLEITGGFAGEQETDLDFSPLLFLPTESGGVNVLVPGIGPVPILALDKIIDYFGPNPTTDPIGYESFIESLSDYVPGMGLHGRDALQRIFGSGFTGLAMNTVSDIGLGIMHNPNRYLGLWTGNLGSELRRSRAVSSQLADETLMNDILSSPDPETATALIFAAWKDANTHAMKVNLFDNLSSWAVPVSGALDDSLDNIYGSWIEVGRSYPDFFEGDELGLSDQELQRNPELTKRLGDDIRRNFWNLEPWQREVIIATNPTVAVNLISTWEWAEGAPQELEGRDVPYRFGISGVTTTSQAMAQHNSYVRRGWVRPRDTSDRPYEIIGRALMARQNSARTLYETAAGETNELLWAEVVSDDTKAMLDGVLASFPVLDRVGITDPKQLWLKWGSERERVIEDMMIYSGLDPLSEEGAELRAAVLEATKMPEAEESWSTDWQGDAVKNFSNRSRQSPVFLNEKALFLAESLGLDVEEGMAGEDFIAEIIEYRSQAEGGAWNAVRYKYSEYTENRGRAFSNAEATLQDLAQNPALDGEWRGHLQEFVDWSANQGDRSVEQGVTRATQDEALQRFNALAETGKDAPVNWDKLWRDGFASVYGPRGWNPPPPKNPFDSDGELDSQAWMPYVRSVVDGDTIEVSQNRGPGIFPGAVRFGESGSGETRVHKVRILGVMAADYGQDADKAVDDHHRLEQALLDAQRNGDTIYLVRDPEYAGSNTDPFGRELAWLWIGDKPFYFPDEMERGT